MDLGAELIRIRARTLPDSPGVYIYRDVEARVLYVGKAKSLRKRVASYTRAEQLDRKTSDLVERVADIETIVADTESEALLLEQNLVKRHRPPFNIRLRDDKSYPFVAVTVGERFPRVLFTRERHKPGVRYFGPFASASRVRETLDVLNRAFPYRPCEGPTPGRRSGVPCLDFHIGRCVAPCVGAVTEAEYRRLIDSVIDVLEGDTRAIERELKARMQDASAEHRFEDAARARNRLHAVQQINDRQLVHRAQVGDMDAIGLARRDDIACVQVFPMRGGRLADRFTFVLENVAGEADHDVIASALAERYVGALAALPPLVCIPGIADDGRLQETLTAWRGTRVEVRAPQRGEKRKLVALAQKNADHSIVDAVLREERSHARHSGAIEDLRDALDLEALPLRIECFDVSNTGGESTMASMVVFENGRPLPAHYRLFGIERDGEPDDFASIAEAVTRRFTRLADTASAAVGEFDPAFGSTPQLVVIDGGRGQLGAALDAINGLDLPRLAVVGLAKRMEEVFVPGRRDPILLPHDTPALQLLQRFATRPTGSRSRTIAAVAPEGRRRRCSSSFPASGRHAARRSSATSPSPPRCSGRRSSSSRPFPVSLPARRGRSSPTFTAPAVRTRIPERAGGPVRHRRLGARRTRLRRWTPRRP